MNQADAQKPRANELTTQEADDPFVFSVSVRTLVEFILRGGDIESRMPRRFGVHVMLAGGQIHKQLQKAAGPDYMAEVPLTHRILLEKYAIKIEGRADGVIPAGKTAQEIRTKLLADKFNAGQIKNQLSLTDYLKNNDSYEEKIPDDIVIIDEIKGTYRNIASIRNPETTHLAQAKCYAYIYALDNGLDFIGVRLTYCQMDSMEIKYFYYEHTFDELKAWFDDLVKKYIRWTNVWYEWQKTRDESLKTMTFPYEYRKGQADLSDSVYDTIKCRSKLFLCAPTGTGKTLSVLYPSLKSMGEKRGQKVFYLSAKNSTLAVAVETYALFAKNGVRFKRTVITAKEKACFLEKPSCNPSDCPHARGHYDRCNEALFDLFNNEEEYTYKNISYYSKKHMVCPFELSLDIAEMSDGIICDYNYVFDQFVALKRFINNTNNDFILLVDEAHNLVERGRDMYSAAIAFNEFDDISSLLDSGKVFSGKQITELKVLLNYSKIKAQDLIDGIDFSNIGYHILHDLGGFTRSLEKLMECLEKCLDSWAVIKVRDMKKKEAISAKITDVINVQKADRSDRIIERVTEFYFHLNRYIWLTENRDSEHIDVAIEERGKVFIKLFCANPGNIIREKTNTFLSTVLFSATLQPISYYQNVLGYQEEDNIIIMPSPFDAQKQGIFIAGDVTSRYTLRNVEQYERIARYIRHTARSRYGNYLVFFPSFEFMEHVAGILKEEGIENGLCLLQEKQMSGEKRRLFLECFMNANKENAGNYSVTNVIHSISHIGDINNLHNENSDRVLIGLCVMGGIFSEGIDLTGESLIGTLIIGTGLPQISSERELIKRSFDEKGMSGFDFAYRFPGMNKVLQAAGRVIRTDSDIGVVELLDERFMGRDYKALLPRDWERVRIVNSDNIEGYLDRFWNEWL